MSDEMFEKVDAKGCAWFIIMMGFALVVLLIIRDALTG